MKYRTDNSALWGSGQGANLQPADVDGNFWELRSALNELIATPPSPVSINSISASGTQMTFHMSDGTDIGPIQLPVLSFVWRGEWAPTTLYNTLDTFRVTGVGLFSTINSVISDTAFDPAAVDANGNPAYSELFAFAPAANLAYDMGFYYPGVISQVPSGVPCLYQEAVVRTITIPAAPSDGSAHQAFLQTAPSTVALAMNIIHNGSNVGTINFTIGQNAGVVNLSTDVVLNPGDVLQVAIPATEDATAAGLSVEFSAFQATPSS